MDTEAVDYDEEPVPPVEAVKNSSGRSKGRGHVMKSPDESDRRGTYDRIEFSESRSGAGVKCIISQLTLAIQIIYFIIFYFIILFFLKTNIN